MVLAGAGVPHARLVELAEARFGADFGRYRHRKAPRVTRVPATYLGGEVQLNASEHPLLHLAVVYEGVPFTDPDLYAMATLQMLLGGGSSFSSGGPGKGMYSRLYTNVLNNYGWVENIQAQMFAYADSALFGITGATSPPYARSWLHLVTTELRRLLVPVHSIELSRAKNQLKSSMLMHLESRAVQLEDMSRQLLGMGAYVPPEQAAALIDAVTEHDLARVVSRLLRSSPSLAVLGDCANAPSLANYVRP
jgi:mitochondrial-processing peptidase subunit alpha